MKTHYAFFENMGNYEQPLMYTDMTICGLDNENVIENFVTDKWSLVTCKKCLKLRDTVNKQLKEEEKLICKEMGDMADFIMKEEANEHR